MRTLFSILSFFILLTSGHVLLAQKTVIMDDKFLDEYGNTTTFQHAVDAYKSGKFMLVDMGNDGNGKTIWRMAVIQQPGNAVVTEKRAPSFLESFSGKDMQGKAVESASWGNKKVWMSFWSLDSPASIDQLFALEEAAEAAKGNDSLIILAVTLDPREKVEQFLKEHPRNLRIIPGAVSWYNILGIKVHPAHALITNGQLSKTIPGLMSKDLLLKEW